jgi:hypothetical protein
MMQNLWNTAERLRKVHAARRQFFQMWAVDCATGTLEAGIPAALTPAQFTRAALASEEAAPPRRDWSWLYRGDVLDD